MFGFPVMRLRFKIQVWGSDFGSRFVIQVLLSCVVSELRLRLVIKSWIHV